VNDDVEARDMRDAWTSVLTRFRDGLTAALAAG